MSPASWLQGTPGGRTPAGQRAMCSWGAADTSGLSYRPNVLADIPRGGLILLRGPRRVGKSVELKRMVQRLLAAATRPRTIVHAAVDGWRASDLHDLVQVGKRLVPAGTEHRYWLIDEVSSVRGWADAVINLRDNDTEFAGDTVVLTGSSAGDLTATRKSLAGRRGPTAKPDRTLLPMGFRAFAAVMMSARGATAPAAGPLEPADLRTPAARQAMDDLLPWIGDLTTWWEIYLQVGGFPQAVAAQLVGDDLAPIVAALRDVVPAGCPRRREPQHDQGDRAAGPIGERPVQPLERHQSRA